MREGELSTKGGGQRLVTTNNTYLCSKKMCQIVIGGKPKNAPPCKKGDPPQRKNPPLEGASTLPPLCVRRS